MRISRLRQFNKNAFTLVELLATIVLIALIMGLVLPSAMRVSKENENRMCEEYANMMEEYAAVSQYKDNYYINLNQLDELSKVKDDCSRTTECPDCGGYVFVDHATTPVTYKAYISCKSGCSTEGYNASIESTKTKITVPTCRTGVVYNGQNQNLVTENPNKYILTNNIRKDAGSQTVRANLTDKRTYAWDDSSQDEKVIRNCSIMQKEFTIKANDILLRRRLVAPNLTYTESGAVSGEPTPLTSNVTFTIKNSSGSVVTYNNQLPLGEYTIIPSASVSSNYKFKGVNGKLTVKNGTFLYALDNQGANTPGTTGIYELYGEGWYSDENATNTITSITKPTKSNSTFYGYYDGTDGSGTQYVNSSGTIIGPTNYEGTKTLYAKWKTNGSLTVSNASMNLTYGTTAYNTYTYNGNGTISCSSSNNNVVTCSVDTTNKRITLVPKAANSANVTITLSATETSTYTGVSNKTFTVKVAARTITLTADNKEKWQSEANPTLTVSASGQVSGETPAYNGALATTATQSSAVGTYPITQGSLSLKDNGTFKAANYTISFKNGTLTVKNPCASGIIKYVEQNECKSEWNCVAGKKLRHAYSTKVSNYRCSSFDDYEGSSCTGPNACCASGRIKYTTTNNCSSSWDCVAGGKRREAYSTVDGKTRCSSFDDNNGGTCYGGTACCASGRIKYTTTNNCSSSWDCVAGGKRREAYSTVDGKTRCSSFDDNKGGTCYGGTACCASGRIKYTTTSSCSSSYDCVAGGKKREAYNTVNGGRCSSFDDWNGGTCYGGTACCASGRISYVDQSSCSSSDPCTAGKKKRYAYSTVNGGRCSSFDDWNGATCYGSGHCYSWNWAQNYSSEGYCRAYCWSGCSGRGVT